MPRSGMESNMTVYQCEDSLEGVFTAIYNAYQDRSDPLDTRISLNGELFLFARYVASAADGVKTLKVMNTLKDRFGKEDYLRICLALSSSHEEKAQAVYQTVALGLKQKCSRGHLFDSLGNQWVHLAFSLARAAENEEHHLRGFLRFRELKNGILFSRTGPKNNLITFLMPHFADRLPGENFLIYDEIRGIFGVHPAGRQWYVVREEEAGRGTGDWKMPDRELSEKEKEYQELFRYFCHKIAVKERENKKLQQNMLPLRFQEYMIEFE